MLLLAIKTPHQPLTFVFQANPALTADTLFAVLAPVAILTKVFTAFAHDTSLILAQPVHVINQTSRPKSRARDCWIPPPLVSARARREAASLSVPQTKNQP